MWLIYTDLHKHIYTCSKKSYKTYSKLDSSRQFSFNRLESSKTTEKVVDRNLVSHFSLHMLVRNISFSD
jgi:hypothetical protein